MRSINSMHVTFVVAWMPPPTGGNTFARLPLGVLSLTQVLRKQGLTVEIRDCQLLPEEKSNESLILHALEGASGIIGISCMSDLLVSVLLAASKYKEQNSEAVIVLGGPGPSSVAKQVLEEFPAVDFIVLGEGEVTFSELIHELVDGNSASDVAGICHRTKNHHAHITKPRARIRNLDSLYPLPYEAIECSRYSTTQPIATSRGCTYGCQFCDVTGIWHRQVTWRGIDNVVAEIEHHFKSGKTRFAIIDDTFILDRQRVLSFCEALREANLPISWHANARINLVDEILLEMMAASGCRSLFFGVESGSDEVLKRVQKAFNVAQVKETIAMCASFIPLVTASFIWGFPFESWMDFQSTRELYLELATLPNVGIQVYKLTPLPSAPLFKEFGSQLYFDPASLAFSIGGTTMIADEIALIRQYPSIFPNYYTFPTEKIEQKMACVQKDLAWMDKNGT